MPTPLEHPNLKLFGEIIETAESSISGRRLHIRLNDEQMALFLSHCLTIELDKHPASSWHMYDRYSLDEHAQLAREDASQAHRYGKYYYETRPADRNYGVRLEQRRNSYGITADVRNAFEDQPKLEGAQFLQAALIRVIESLELN